MTAIPRRAWLRGLLAGAVVSCARVTRAGQPPGDPDGPRRLAFRNLHTGEAVEVVYRVGGRYDIAALREIAWVLRDHRAGEARRVDRALLELLSRLRDTLGTTEPYEVISGYRSPATNALLVRTTDGVAPRSLHVQARAIDLRVPDRPLEAVRAAALALRRGGVGYYPRSGFVHVDVGPVRWWAM
jgi:uncharacterized protein YcbK (DUF882 family)